jgi:hypothetical protein
VHEIKHDGYRLIARRNGDRVRLYTRRGFNWADCYPRIVDALRSLRAHSVVIDGEAVVCEKDGRSDFDRLHPAPTTRACSSTGFDLIELDGEDLRPAPLEQRKGKLEKLLRPCCGSKSGRVRMSAIGEGMPALISDPLALCLNGPRREGDEPTPAMYGGEKSDQAIVAMKLANKPEQSAAESVERRARAEGNCNATLHARRTQRRRRCTNRWTACGSLIRHYPRWEPYAGKPHVRFCAGGAQQ